MDSACLQEGLLYVIFSLGTQAVNTSSLKSQAIPGIMSVSLPDSPKGSTYIQIYFTR